MKPKDQKRIDLLCLEFATEAELEAVAEHGTPERQQEARTLLHARCRELALRAARDLAAGLDKVWPEWREGWSPEKYGTTVRNHRQKQELTIVKCHGILGP